MSAVKEAAVYERMRTNRGYNRFQPLKILRHADRIEMITRNEIPSPVEWVIYPSNVCGYQCGHCIMAKEQTDHRGKLSQAAMAKIAPDAVEHGIKCVIFSGGGDPLLNSHTTIAAYALKKAGVSVGINNQGYHLADPLPYDFIRFSVDAATPGTYKEIHGFDGWVKVITNIRNVQRIRREGKKVELGLAFLITPANWHETIRFCEWAQQFEPDFIHVRPAYLAADYLDKEYPGGDAALKDGIVPKLKDLASEIEERFENVFFRIDKFEGFWTPKKYDQCRANPLIAVTSGDGAFLICQDRGIMKEESYLRWGDYNTQSFRDIWWSDEHRSAMSSIDLDKCPRCVENAYNEIIQYGFVEDRMKMDLL